MKKWILVTIFLITVCSGCKSTKTSTQSDIHITNVTTCDTVRVVNNYHIVDTTHVEYRTTTTTRTVEYYDPETGQLRQRVIDQESNIRFLQDQLFSLQSILDSLRMVKADSSNFDNHIEEIEEEVEKQSWWEIHWRGVCAYIIGIIICVLIIKIARRLS